MIHASNGLKILALATGFCALALAQAGSETAPARVISPTRGFQPSHSYALSDIESIDQASGAMSFHIPLAQLPPGPAGFTAGVTLSYSSKYWETEPNVNDSVTPTYQLKKATAGGWRLAMAPELEPEYLTDRGQPADDPCGPSGAADVFHLRLINPDGSRHQLFLSNPSLDMGLQCEPGTYTRSRLSAAGTGPESWYTTDGTFLRLVIASGPLTSDLQGWVDSTEWTLYRPDGSQVHHLATGSKELKDRNGNKITIAKDSSGTILTQTMTDDFGRTITVVTDNSALTDTIKMTVYDESTTTSQTLQWTVNWSSVSTASFPQYQCIAPLHNQGGSNCPFLSGSLLAVSTIQLPNNLSYSFAYGGTYGEVTSVTMPMGASAAYTWRLDPTGDGGTHCGVACYFDVLANTINKKVLSHDGTTDTWRYTYAIGASGAILGSSIQAPDGGTTGYSFDPIEFQFTSSAFAGAITTINHPDGSVTQREWTNNIPHEYPGTGIPNQPTANKFVTREWTTTANSSLAPVGTSLRVFTADKNGNTRSQEEHGWVAFGQSSSGALLRKTVSTYVNQSRDSQDTAADNNAYSSASFTPAPLNLAASIEVQSGAGTVVSRSTLSYQESSPPRMVGNLVQKLTWDSSRLAAIAQGANLDSNNAIGWTYSYSPRGNLLTETDPKNHITASTYGVVGGCTSAPSDLYRTAMSRGGVYVASQNWTYTLYNCTTGQVLTMTDPAGLVTTVTHDRYGRPTTVAEGAFRTTTHAYDDVARTILTHDDVDNPADGKNVSKFSYDQLGRISEQRQQNAGLADVVSQTRYILSSGRNETWVSNPDDSVTGTPQGWTVTRRDTVGRVCVTESFSGSANPAVTAGCGTPSPGSTGSTLHSFDATVNWTSETVTDPAGKQRTQYQDALGQLVAVVEDPGSLKYSTYYQYDTLGNLTKVRQVGTCAGDPVTAQCGGGQSRDFTYTSLKRLWTATNVENGTITYTYDYAGNVNTRQQGALTRTNYYDELNRLTSQTYNDGTTPTVAYTYDAAQPQIPANCAASNGAMGRLSSVSNSVSTSYYFYNQMGYAQCRRQTTGGTNYDSRYTTTPQGAWSQVVYPSGRSVTTTFNTRGQAVSVGSYASAAAYWPHGGLRQVTLGTAVVQQGCYNSRLQMTGMRVTAAGASWNNCANVNGDLLTLGYDYGSTGNNGDVQSQTINVPYLNAGNQQTQTMVQQYGYDRVGRIGSVSETVSGLPGTVTPAPWGWTFGADAYGNQWGTNTLGMTAQMAQDGSYFDTATNRLVKYGALPGTTLPGTPYDTKGNLQNHPQVCANGGNACMQYDGEGRLTQVTNGGNGTTYEYDGEGRRVRKTASGTATVVYAYGADGELMAEYGTAGSGGTQYLAADGLGSTRLVMNGSGGVLERLDYFPFGQEIPAGESYGNRNGARVIGYGTTTGLTVQFTGKERDAETGLDYFQTRYFSSAQGRYTSPDPLMASARPSNPQTWNRYAYGLNNPLRYIDPDGMKEISVADCQKDSNCTVVSMNVILDKNANNGNGLTKDQMASFNKVLQGAKDDLGNGNIALNVSYTSGEVTDSGVSGLSSSAANVFLSSYVPTSVTGNAMVSGALNGATVPDPTTHGDVMFISANNAHSEMIGSGIPFIASFTNTITHELLHNLSGDTSRRGDNAVTTGWHEFQIDRQASGLHYDINYIRPEQMQRAKMYSPPVHPDAVKPGKQ